jgi:uncharacterized membrane protein
MIATIIILYALGVVNALAWAGDAWGVDKHMFGRVDVIMAVFWPLMAVIVMLMYVFNLKK